MARPLKEGVDYFPLDVFLDDKFELIEAVHGIVGFGIIIKLYQKIYAHSYYIEFTERHRLVFSKRINVDINLINAVIMDSLKWEVFDRKLYEKYTFLTSKGIQKRYFEIVKRRKKVSINQSALLIDHKLPENVIKVVNVDKNPINDNDNSINTCSGTQRKGKGKGKESKKPNITPVEKNSTPRRVIELLNQVCGKNFNTQTEAHRKAIKARLSEGHTFEDFKTVIEFKNQDWTKDAVFTHQDGKTKKVRDYLQPSTLFSNKNFDKYLNEASSSGFVKSSNLKSKEEVLTILNKALKEKTEADTFRVIKELDPDIYAIVQSKCQMFFVNRESDFGVIYRNYTGK